jgi:diacylglycerol kinase (ATP)
MPDSPTPLIVNGSAGSGRALRLAGRVAERLTALGCAVEIVATRSAAEASKLARAQADRGPGAILACGGDGTVHHVCNAVAESETAVGIIPAGRANDLAGALRIPRKPDQIASLYAPFLRGEREPTRMDLGRTGDRLFTTVAAFGVDSAISQRALDKGGGKVGRVGYLTGAIAELTRHKPAWAELSGDFGTREGPVLLCATANTPVYGGWYHIAPDASPTDGLFHVCLIHGMSRLRALRMLPRVITGGHVKDAYVEMLVTRELHIETREPLPLFADGEPLGQTPVTFTNMPGALRILADNGATTV